jgi:hypothetical protein
MEILLHRGDNNQLHHLVRPRGFSKLQFLPDFQLYNLILSLSPLLLLLGLLLGLLLILHL